MGTVLDCARSTNEYELSATTDLDLLDIPITDFNDFGWHLE
jgi:hypothetical protein